MINLSWISAFAIILITGCSTGCARPERIPDAPPEPPISVPVGPFEYDVFVENSGSMYGYLNGPTSFKEDLYDLLTRFSEKEDNYRAFAINEDVFPIRQEESASDIEGINPGTKVVDQCLRSSWLRKKGNISSSDVNEIILKVCDSVREHRRTAVLISDYIYSISHSDNIRDELFKQKYRTKEILQRMDADYALMVIKFMSDFDGKYYPYNSPNEGFEHQGRLPYYALVIGPKSGVGAFIDRHNVTNLKGYQNHFIFHRPEVSNRFYYSVLPNSYKEGDFRKLYRGEGPIHDLDDVRPSSRGEADYFQLAVAVDLSKEILPMSYLGNESNYEARLSSGDQARVVDVATVERAEVDQRDAGELGSATHIIVLQVEDISASEAALTIMLKQQLPSWLAESGNENDTELQAVQQSTFGFAYLYEGIKEAFHGTDENQSYFSISINLKR